MQQGSFLTRVAFIAGMCLLVGTFIPSPWRSISFPVTLPPDQAGGGWEPDGKRSGRGLVPVELYAEALCPDTTQFIHDTLAPLFKNGIATLMSFQYIAFGKAKHTPEGLQCQHGPPECRANRYINCAQKLHPRNTTNWFEYVLCVQGKPAEEIEEAASSSCAEQRGWDVDELSDCAEGDLGDSLERHAGRASTALNLTFVPWVLVNGYPINADLGHLGRFVCAAYAGSPPRPAACYEALTVQQPWPDAS